MKKENGITLVSLVVYVIVMIIVIGIMSSIISNFYNNTEDININTENVIEVNKFNTYFLKEIKTRNNSIDTIDSNNSYILFSTGNSFSLANKNIYFNNTLVCKNVEKFEVKKGINSQGQEDDTIINVNIKINDFEKTINYKIEEIY